MSQRLLLALEPVEDDDTILHALYRQPFGHL
jgi:hypothetical protein